MTKGQGEGTEARKARLTVTASKRCRNLTLRDPCLSFHGDRGGWKPRIQTIKT